MPNNLTPRIISIAAALMLLHGTDAGSLHAQQLLPWLESPIISWTNMARYQQGRGPLTFNRQLTQAAQMHALNMAAHETMSHSLDGMNLVDRINRVGYAYANVGENVAFNFGYQNPSWNLFESWLKSPGHWQNMMNEQFTEIGVGVAISATGRYYACQVFGRPAMPMSPYLYPYPSYGAVGGRTDGQHPMFYYWYAANSAQR